MPKRVFASIVRIAAVAFFLLFPHLPHAFAMSSTNVPLGHWSYNAIEKMTGMRLINSSLLGTKPYTRMEVARLTREAMDASEYTEPQPLVAYILNRLKEEFKEELAALSEGGAHRENFIKPVEEAQARYAYTEGKPGRGFPTGSGRPTNQGSPLVYNNDGTVYGEHSNGSFQFSSTFTLAGVFSGAIEPILVLRQNSGSGLDEFEADVLRGYGKFSKWNVEIEGGRDSLWWGQGYRGSLLLTNNAFPLDLVKVSNPSPSLLPWIFHYLGPFKYTLFASKLGDDDQPNTTPCLAGGRINFKPFPDLEIGGATTFMFDEGDHRQAFGMKDFADVFTFTSGPSKTYQLAALDFRYRLPFFLNPTLYSEIGVQSTEKKSSSANNAAFLFGFYIPAVTADGRADLRLEYADDTTGASRGSIWYWSNTFASGYTRDALILGHPMGSEAKDVFARSTYYLRPDLVVGMDFDYTVRLDPEHPLNVVEEKTNQLGADVTYTLMGNLSVSARYGYGSTTNFEWRRGVDDESHLLMTILRDEF